MNADRQAELLNLIVQTANSILEDELNSLRTWLFEMNTGIITLNELKSGEFQALIKRVRAMILPEQLTLNWEDPVDGWKHYSPAKEAPRVPQQE